MIANDGYMLTPHIISKTVDGKTQDVKKYKIEKTERIVSTDTVDKIKDLMENVVKNPGATGNKYYIEGFDIIGKTGTAQIYENGHYLTGKNDYISSVSLMYPKENPRIIIYAATKKPKYNINTALYSSVQTLTKNISKYYNMFSDMSANDSKSHLMNNYTNKKVSNATSDLSSKRVNVAVIGDGDVVINQYPKKNTELVHNNKVILLTNGSNRKMPSVINWSRNDIINLANMLNIEYKFNGNGYAVSQSIPEGSDITGVLEVNLENK